MSTPLTTVSCIECSREVHVTVDSAETILQCARCREYVCDGSGAAGVCIAVHLHECRKREQERRNAIFGRKHTCAEPADIHDCNDCGDPLCEKCAGVWDLDCHEHDGMRWYSLHVLCVACDKERVRSGHSGPQR